MPGLPIVLGLFAGLCFLLTGFRLALSETVEWREEVALHDGGTVIVTGRIQFVPGEPFHTMPGARRFTFTHPTTGRLVIWENPGKIGSRVNPKMLDFDRGQPHLVTLAQAAPDYEAFGCPTPPYIVFRFDADWVRIRLAELPTRFTRMNLYPDPDANQLKAQNYFIRAAVTAKRYRDSFPGDDEYKLEATVDRRIRNPIGLGCLRPERAYGTGSYARMSHTGNWLDKTEDEALKLLWGDRGGAKP